MTDEEGIYADTFSEALWPDPRRGPWGIRANWIVVDGRPECVGLHIWRGARQDPQSPLKYLKVPGSKPSPITATEVRQLPVHRILEQLREVARDHEERKIREFAALAAASGEDRMREFFEEEAAAWERTDAKVGAPRQYGLAHFVAVAEVYLDAWGRGRNPTQAVCEHFHVSRSTAAKWVARCRSSELELLTPATHGRAGAQPGPRLRKLRKRGNR